MEEAPVRQHDHVLPVISDRVRLRRIDDQGTVVTELLLQARMAVIPVGARLLERKLVGKGRMGLDAREANARDPVHFHRNEQTVPVDRGVFVEVIGHCKPHGLSLTQPDQGRGDGAVDDYRVPGASIDVEGGIGDLEPNVVAGQGRHSLRGEPGRARLRPCREQAREPEPGSADGS